MSPKASYKAASASFGLYGGLFKDITQEVGFEKAAAMHANRGKEFGAQVAAMMKQELGGKKLTLNGLESMYSKILEQMGIKPEIAKKRSTLISTVHQCPVYEGLKNAGLDHNAIEKMCTQMSLAEYEQLKDSFPMLSICLKFRSTPDEPCVEEFVIIKETAKP